MSTRTEQVLNRKAEIDKQRHVATITDLQKKERAGREIHESHMQEVSNHAHETLTRFETGENLRRSQELQERKRSETEAEIQKKFTEGAVRKQAAVEAVADRARALDAPL
ncbi:hypothetical protein HK097_007439 [Rhizophlyctis rosea]|uniref:Uncharacterized protein n=1 Tax=Rhizophlyctis rosea TaxID=64517 RepID=A0AAD5SD20_9FUNG|nr:hypothetical protein HK097_007439 [Rhizophlyctis rosea]